MIRIQKKKTQINFQLSGILSSLENEKIKMVIKDIEILFSTKMSKLKRNLVAKFHIVFLLVMK